MAYPNYEHHEIRSTNLNYGDKIKIIDAGKGAWVANNLVGIVTDKSIEHGLPHGTKENPIFKVEIIGGYYNGSVIGVSCNGRYELIKD